MIERSTETKETIVVPVGTVTPNHLEYKVVGEADGTFTVVEYTAGVAPIIKYAGFPNRREAEKFVLAQPYPWESVL